jgi:hypothetical protein
MSNIKDTLKSKSEIEELIEHLETLKEDHDNPEEVQSQIDKFKNLILEGGDSDGNFDLLESYDEGMSSILDSFKGDKLKSDKTKAALGALSSSLELVSKIGDGLIGKDQISESKASLDSLETPSKAKPFKRSENLQGAIRDVMSKSTTQGVDSRTAGLRQDILDRYNTDINTAKVASTGQAGSFGSYSQAASNNKLRGAVALNDAKTRLRDLDRNERRNLISQEIAENQAANVSERERARLDYTKYRDAANAAGRGLAAGRVNSRNARVGILNAIPNAVRNMSSMRDLYKKNTTNEGKIPTEVYSKPSNTPYRFSGTPYQGTELIIPKELERNSFLDADSLFDFERNINNY